MKTTVALRAAIYTRFSSDEGDSDSCAVQEAEATKKVGPQGWSLAPGRIYSDDGISGREMIRRPGFSRLLSDAASRAFDVVLVRDLDRFARGDVARVLGVLQALADAGVMVWEYTKRDFVRLDGENVLMTTFRAYANRIEALKASTRIKEKLIVRDAEGGFTGKAPYGFRNVRRRGSEIGVFMDRKATVGTIVPDEKEHPVLLQLPEMFCRLGTYNAVAMELNRRYIPDPGGTQNWQSQTVRAILVNPFYRGKIVRSRRTTVEQGGTLKRLPSAPEDIRTYDRPEFRVWDDDTIKRLEAQIQARARSQTWSMGVRKHLASSFLRCRCGGTIVPSSSPRAPTYCCSRVKGHACTAGLGYRNEQVVDRALVEACGALLSEEVIGRTRAIITAALDVRVQHDTRLVERDRLTRDIATAEKRVRSAEELVLDSDGPERDRYRASLREQLARLAALREQLREVDAQEPPPDPRAVLKDFDARIQGLRETIAQGGMAALPVVQAILGGQRLTVTRTPEGRWELCGKAAMGALYGDREVRRSQVVQLLVH